MIKALNTNHGTFKKPFVRALRQCFSILKKKDNVSLLIKGPKWANAIFAQKFQRFTHFSKLIREMPFF